MKCASCSVKIKTDASFDSSKKLRFPRCNTILKVSSFDPEVTIMVKDTPPPQPPGGKPFRDHRRSLIAVAWRNTQTQAGKFELIESEQSSLNCVLDMEFVVSGTIKTIAPLIFLAFQVVFQTEW